MALLPQPGTFALVTGASSGIGRQFAWQLAAAGHDLVVTARRQDRIEQLAEELRAAQGLQVHAIACDVSEPDSRQALCEQITTLGLTIDVLVLCAGFGVGGAFITQDPARVQLMLRTNFEGVVALAGAFAPGMAERRRGSILMLSSLAGNQPIVGLGAYAATKAAVTSFAESLHEELRHHGVVVSVLCPGAVATEFAGVADVEHTTTRLPAVMVATAEGTARAGLDALARRRRHVVPGLPSRLFHFAGGHIPRALWLRAGSRFMT